MIINGMGRELPDQIDDYKVIPFVESYNTNVPDQAFVTKRKAGRIMPGQSKLIPSLKEAILASGLNDGMTISFHHCFRAGDLLVAKVLQAIRELGIKDLRFAPSAVTDIRNPSIVEFIEDGTINRVEASGIRGLLGNAVLEGKLQRPAILRPHGARPYAIETGRLSIDVAFVGASAADDYGNCTGQLGPNACGALGHSMIDVKNAACVIVVTDYLVDYPCFPVSISQQYVDYVVKIDAVGDPARIGTGAIRITKNPRDLLIAEQISTIITSSRRFQDGFTFQIGAGAISMAAISKLSKHMREQQVTSALAIGGVPMEIVKMYDDGLIKNIACVQSFDADSARAMISRPRIVETDNAAYANAYSKGCLVNREDFGILGALEVDVDYNVNILTGSTGEMLGGLGGGPDVAAGAQISIVGIPVIRGRIPTVVKRVFTACTPGDTVAAVVTEAGVALNPKHRNYDELKEDLQNTGLKLVSIESLQRLAESLTGTPDPIETTDRVTCIVEYRDGTVIDVIHQIKR